MYSSICVKAEVSDIGHIVLPLLTDFWVYAKCELCRYEGWAASRQKMYSGADRWMHRRILPLDLWHSWIPCFSSTIQETKSHPSNIQLRAGAALAWVSFFYVWFIVNQSYQSITLVYPISSSLHGGRDVRTKDLKSALLQIRTAAS